MTDRFVILDVEKTKKKIEKCGKKYGEIARELGLSNTFLSGILTDRPDRGHKAGEMKRCYLTALCEALECDPEDILAAEKKEEEVKPEMDLVQLDEVIEAVNKLGNIQMQMLEYMRVIMNDMNTCSHNMKQLNEKWNKPSAYRKGNH